MTPERAELASAARAVQIRPAPPRHGRCYPRRMFRFLPKDEGFFDLFEHMAATLVEAATRLDEFLTSTPTSPNRADQIHNIEHSGDNLTREAISKLHRTFITPFDRDALHDLTCRLDDVLDRIDEAADRMVALPHSGADRGRAPHGEGPPKAATGSRRRCRSCAT